MATPPTFIAENETTSGWDTDTDPQATAAFSSAIGDVWVTGILSENNSMPVTTPTNTGTAQTFTRRGNVNTANKGWVDSYTTVVANTLTTQTVNIDPAGGNVSDKVGFTVLRFSGSAGIGAVPTGEAEAAGTGPSLTFTTIGDNSAIVVFVSDWAAADGTSRTWRTVNGITPTAGNGMETTYFRNAANYTVYVGYYSDAGAAGSKTVGLSAPTMEGSIVAIEVLGTAGAAAADPKQALPAHSAVPFVVPFPSPAAPVLQLLGDAATRISTTVVAASVDTVTTFPAATVQTGSTATPAAIVTATSVGTATVQTGETVVAAAVATVTALPAPSLSTGETVTPAAVATVTDLPAPTLQTGSTVLAASVDTVAGVPAPSLSASSAADPFQASPQIPWLLSAPEPQLQGDATTPGAAVDATVNAVAIATVTALPAASLSTGSAVVASAVATVTDLPSPNVSGGTTADPNQAGLQTAWMFTSPRQSSIQLTGSAATPFNPDATVTPATIVTAVSVGSASLSTGETVLPSAIATVSTLPAPTVQTAGNATVVASAIATVTALPAPALSTGEKVLPAAIATVTTLPAASLAGNANVSPAAIATVTALPAPSVKTGSTVSAVRVATVTAINAPTVVAAAQSNLWRLATGTETSRVSTGYRSSRASTGLG